LRPEINIKQHGTITADTGVFEREPTGSLFALCPYDGIREAGTD
jgi:hypothetical protein